MKQEKRLERYLRGVRGGLPILFLDCGDFILDCEFNKDTLFRAHRLALDYIHNWGSKEITLDQLAEAHNKVIQTYLAAREKDNSEWRMTKIVDLIVQDLGLTNFPLLALEEIYMSNDHNSEPVPDAYRRLEQLSQKAKLGVISNLPHDSIISELVRYNLSEFFNPIVISYQVGYRKPHPAIYQEAIKRANTTPENSIFASHDKEEVEGAEKVGMRGILVKSLDEVMGAL